MPDNSTAAADELRTRARFFRVGCLANMILAALLVALLVVIFPLIARTLGLSTPDTDAKAIRAVLDAQAAAWNNGDIDGFMTGYWHDEGLTFISGGDVNQGWNATRERFIKTYRPPDKPVNMGKLSFNELHVESLSPSAAMVRGRYQLDEIEKPAWGRFTLIFRKLPDGWRIVHDHTSKPDPTAPTPPMVPAEPLPIAPAPRARPAGPYPEKKLKAQLGCKVIANAIDAFTSHPGNPMNQLPSKMQDLSDPPFGGPSLVPNGNEDFIDVWGQMYMVRLLNNADGTMGILVFTLAPDGTPISQFGIGEDQYDPSPKKAAKPK